MVQILSQTSVYSGLCHRINIQERHRVACVLFKLWQATICKVWGCFANCYWHPYRRADWLAGPVMAWMLVFQQWAMLPYTKQQGHAWLTVLGLSLQ